MDKIVFELQDSIKVQSNIDGRNDFVDLKEIYLVAPTYKQKDLTLVLKKKFIEAQLGLILNMPKDKAESSQEGEGKLNAQAVKLILYGAKDFDIVAYFASFAKILQSVAFKDESCEQKLNQLEIEKLSENDFENLLARYFEVFFISLWMRTLN